MLFNSLHFLIFFPLVSAAYFLLPHRMRWFLLLAASCYFYMAFVPTYILILLVTILIDYAAAILIEDATARWRKPLLIVSIASTCLVLFVFKYMGFVTGNVARVMRALHLGGALPTLSLLLPIGLSFHTFQSLSYVIEVYRGHQKAERHLGLYALYVMFYPQLVAGPIERPQNLLHQFRENHSFDYGRVTEGLRLMAWGLFKKVVIADRLSDLVNPVYDAPRSFGGLALVLATIFFAYQIYCDFSGYSDVAIGAAQVMGFRLMTNFDRPYAAQSIAEFWRRWHISLSTWFRDYVYIPLGGNRRGVPRHYANLMITFVISGLWHGANWTFLMWGALHGLYLICGSATAPLRQRAIRLVRLQDFPVYRRVLARASVFVLVGIGWILFRARSLSDASYIFTHLLSPATADALPGPQSEVLKGVALIAFLEGMQWLQGKGRVSELLAGRAAPYRWAVYFGIVYVTFFYMAPAGEHQFIYFQF